MIFNIQRFSTHDGPGVRTVVFLKGCPLRCEWCENPESQSPRSELFYDRRICIGCLECLHSAADGEITLHDEPSASGEPSPRPVFHRERIRQPEKFREVCPTGALSVVGEEQRVEQIVSEVEKDRPFYRGVGGATISGGEPYAQPRFFRELLEKLAEHRIDVVVESSLEASWTVIEPTLPLVSLFLADLKHFDAAAYRAGSGGDLSLVLDNFRRLEAAGARVVVRVPVIPGFNDSEETMREIAHYASTLSNVDSLHLLPYHSLGRGKYKALGRGYALEGTAAPPAQRLAAYVKVAECAGLRVSIGG